MDFEPIKMVDEAVERTRPFIQQTPLIHSPHFSQKQSAHVQLKCENLQHTGSFKVRGALNKIISLSAGERERGIITASTGNHGAACAFAVQQVGGQAIVYVPETASETKLAAIRRLGATIRTFGTDSAETEQFARETAVAENRTYIPPYNDPFVVAGQGTIGHELLAQLPELDAVFISVGGGGLISGIGSYLKSKRATIQIVGCSPQNSQVMAESVKAGQLLDLPSLPTLSDGTAGGIEPNAMTFPLCQQYVDQFIAVSEAEIADSLCEFMEVHHMLIEGSAAVALAAYAQCAAQFEGQKVAIVLCGANISLDTLKKIL